MKGEVAVEIRKETEELSSMNAINILDLANELTYRKYLFGNDNFRSFFKNIKVVEYVILHMIMKNETTSAIYSGRTYLQELSEKLQISIHQTSKIMKELQNKGLVIWSHDGDGSSGTYVMITEDGRKTFVQQEENVKMILGNAIQSFGTDNMLQMLRLMKEFGTVLSSVIEQQEGDEQNA